MKISSETLDDGVILITLDGRMDVFGTHDIEACFVALTGPSTRSAIVDFEKVDFVASVGVRMLVVAAKGLKARGGKLALFRTSSAVSKILETAGITLMIPLHLDREAALAAVR
jgi:anti-anti-sigma factor